MENKWVVKEISIIQAKYLPIQERSDAAIVKIIDQLAEKPAYPTRHIFSDLENTINTISGLPGFQSIMDDLNRKYDRLNKRSYTIALFGAFSAGKSYLANALIGAHVHPSTPNTPIVAINRI